MFVNGSMFVNCKGVEPILGYITRKGFMWEDFYTKLHFYPWSTECFKKYKSDSKI